MLRLAVPIVTAARTVKARVPKDEDARFKPNPDVLGAVEIDRRLLSFDSVVYHSKIHVYDLYGDFALRLQWGPNPQFALSTGGLHPRFTPLANFPGLRRLRPAVSYGSSFELGCQVYQALTSNTLQFGASVNAHAEACGVQLDGYLTLATLLRFSPFPKSRFGSAGSPDLLICHF